MGKVVAEVKDDRKEEDMPVKKRILLGVGLPLWVLFVFLLVNDMLVSILRFFFIDRGIPVEEYLNIYAFNTLVTIVIFSLTLLVVIWVPLRLFKIRTTKEELGLTRLPNWTDILLTPPAFIIYTILAAVLLAVTRGLFPDFDINQEQETGFSDISQTYEYVLAFITLVLVAPIAEEVLMRGYLYGKMRPVVGVVIAALVSSLLFSLMHFQWNVALNVLPLGIVMVVLREMTGSIWAGVLLHMLKNGIAYYLLFINPSILDTMVI